MINPDRITPAALTIASRPSNAAAAWATALRTAPMSVTSAGIASMPCCASSVSLRGAPSERGNARAVLG